MILARPLKKSFSQHVQMVGRGARFHEGKKFCMVQDHAGNWLRFLNDWNDLYHDGVKELTGEQDKKPRKEPTEKEKKAAKCPKCGCVFPSSSDICAHCGYVRQKRNDAIAVAGEMLELSAAPAPVKYDSATKERWYQEMIGYCRQRGKSDGAAYHWYLKKFGVLPVWKKQPAIPSPEVIDYCRSRLIAYAKAMHK